MPVVDGIDGSLPSDKLQQDFPIHVGAAVVQR